MTGIERIAAERKRQIEQEGWTAGHDDQHHPGELAWAAYVYAMAAGLVIDADGADPPVLEQPLIFPFGPAWWKPSTDPVRNLEKSGALIAAEIDRILRARGGGA